MADHQGDIGGGRVGPDAQARQRSESTSSDCSGMTVRPAKDILAILDSQNDGQTR